MKNQTGGGASRCIRRSQMTACFLAIFSVRPGFTKNPARLPPRSVVIDQKKVLFDPSITADETENGILVVKCWRAATICLTGQL